MMLISIFRQASDLDQAFHDKLDFSIRQNDEVVCNRHRWSRAAAIIKDVLVKIKVTRYATSLPLEDEESELDRPIHVSRRIIHTVEDHTEELDRPIHVSRRTHKIISILQNDTEAQTSEVRDSQKYGQAYKVRFANPPGQNIRSARAA